MVLYSCCSTLKICASRRMMPYECVCICVYMCLCAMNALRLLFCISSTAYRPTWAYNETALDSCISLSLCPLLRRFFIPLVNDENSYITPSSTILRLWNNRISHFYLVFFFLLDFLASITLSLKLAKITFGFYGHPWMLPQQTTTSQHMNRYIISASYIERKGGTRFRLLKNPSALKFWWNFESDISRTVY